VVEGVVGVSVTQLKWEKGLSIVQGLVHLCFGGLTLPELNHKQLEKERGFLTHLSMTFEAIVLFLRGFHLTIDQWRLGRDSEGWARTDKEHREWMKHFYLTYEGQDDLIYEMVNSGAPSSGTYKNLFCSITSHNCGAIAESLYGGLWLRRCLRQRFWINIF
jgi:hypothetical protein